MALVRPAARNFRPAPRISLRSEESRSFVATSSALT